MSDQQTQDQQQTQVPLSAEQYIQLVQETTASMLAILNIEMQAMMDPQRQANLDPLDPAHFAIAAYLVGKLQLIANNKAEQLRQQQEVSNVDQIRQDTTLVDRFGKTLTPDPEIIIDGEFREVGRGN